MQERYSENFKVKEFLMAIKFSARAAAPVEASFFDARLRGAR